MTWCLVLLPDNVILYKDGQRQSIVPTETDVYSITAVSEDDSTVVKLSHRTLVNMRAADYNVLVCEPRALLSSSVPGSDHPHETLTGGTIMIGVHVTDGALTQKLADWSNG